MSRRYAANTDVSVEKSKMEIEGIVRRYGADGFASGWTADKATVQFSCKNRQVRFVVTLPRRDDKQFTEYRRTERGTPQTRAPHVALEHWEQACRQKWRALALLVKAKLEAVDAGIATFEESFFADIVMPDGRTVYEVARKPLELAYATRKNVPLLLGVSP